MATSWKMWAAFQDLIAGTLSTPPRMSLIRPIKEVAFVGDFKYDRTITLPRAVAGTPNVGVPTKLWDYTMGVNFEVLWLQLRSGYAYLGIDINKATSSTDTTPDPGGTFRRSAELDLSCHTPFILNTKLARVHATLATAAGFTSNVPNLIRTDQAGLAEGRVYALWGTNPSITEDLLIDVFGRN